jgi:hypothetical protein
MTRMSVGKSRRRASAASRAKLKGGSSTGALRRFSQTRLCALVTDRLGARRHLSLLMEHRPENAAAAEQCAGTTDACRAVPARDDDRCRGHVQACRVAGPAAGNGLDRRDAKTRFHEIIGNRPKVLAQHRLIDREVSGLETSPDCPPPRHLSNEGLTADHLSLKGLLDRPGKAAFFLRHVCGSHSTSVVSQQTFLTKRRRG